ncbi:TPA: malonyl CoA-acyl carrier protein transacylase, partial [bacterium]|nr:malonyl CoA-acyl carrier protein transacylase [bacterium]
MKKAFIFPGQGSQAVEMGKALAEKFSVAAEIFDRANNILGWDLKKIAREDPNEELVRTDRTQPALFTTSVAALEVLRSFGIEPDAVAGHSIG